MTKSKKPNLIKCKKTKNLEFTIANFFRTDFLTSKAKKVFIYLQKTFTKILILWNLILKHYIHIKTDVLEYAIWEILSQITSNQDFSTHVIHKYP